MKKKIVLDEYEQSIEDDLENYVPAENMEEMMRKMTIAAKEHLNAKKPITLRVPQTDLEVIKIKASKMGVSYQTYLNIMIHRDATIVI